MLPDFGKTELPVVVTTENGRRLLREIKHSDRANKDVGYSQLFFRRTPENHIIVVLEGPFHSEHVIGLYRGPGMEWSSMLMYGMDISAELACYLPAHCESLVDSKAVQDDYLTHPDADNPRKSRVAMPGELAGRFAERLFETIFANAHPMFGERKSPIEHSLDATIAVLGLLAGRHEDFPRMDLVVNQNQADIEYRRMRGGETYAQDTRITMDATRLVDVVHQHDIVKGWFRLME